MWLIRVISTLRAISRGWPETDAEPLSEAGKYLDVNDLDVNRPLRFRDKETILHVQRLMAPRAMDLYDVFVIVADPGRTRHRPLKE